MAIRQQDTVEMFSRLDPRVQTQVLQSMGLTPQQVQQMVGTIGQNSTLQRDSPDIVNQWNQLFGNSLNLDTLGSSIFSDSVHPEDADHNYHNYGAIQFDPGHGLVSTPDSGQYGEPNHRGLRQLEPFLPAIAGLGLMAFGIPAIFGEGGALGGLLGGAAAEDGLGALPLLEGGGVNALDTGLLDSFGSGALDSGLGAGAFDQFGSTGLGDVFAGSTDLSQGFGPFGGLDPETANGAGGMGVSQNGIGPGTFADRLTGAINNPSSLLSGDGLFSGASSLMPNSLSSALRLAGLGTSVAGLFGHPGGGAPSTNNTGAPSDKGGSGKGLDISRGQYTPNPYTQQQLQNFQYAQPRGR